MVRNTLKLVALAFALGTSGAALAQSPATLCDVAPAQITQAANLKVGTSEARKALYNSATAVRLCSAGAAYEAQKKFKVAYKALNLDFAAALAKTGGQAN
jgi:hypothetical protein